MWNQILLGLCAVQVAVAINPFYTGLDSLGSSIPQPHHLKQNLYGLSQGTHTQNKKASKSPTYVVDDATQNLGDQGGVVGNLYGGVDKKKQELIPQNSALYSADDLNPENVYGNVEKPLQSVYQPKKDSNPNQYEVADAPAYPANTASKYSGNNPSANPSNSPAKNPGSNPSVNSASSPAKYSGNNPSANPAKSPAKYSGNNPSANPVKSSAKYPGNKPPAYQETKPAAFNPDDILYLTPDDSKTLDQVSQKEDGSVYETVKKVRKVKVPESQGPYDGATYSVNDNYQDYQPTDNQPEQVLVNKDQLEQLKSEIQDIEDAAAANQYSSYPETVTIPIQDGYNFPQGQQLVCTVQYV